MTYSKHELILKAMAKGGKSGFSFARLGLVTALVVLVGLGAGYVVSSRQQTEADVVSEKIVIANVGEYSIFNLIAQEKGMFTQNGLDAEVKEYASGPPGVADMLAGAADFAVAADFVGVNQIFAKQDLRILAQASEHDIFSVVGRKDQGIAAPADVKNKRIGVTRKGAGEFFLGRFLIFNNLSLSDIVVVDLQPADLVKQLEAGQLDGIVIFEPHGYNLRQTSLGDKLSFFSAQGEEKTRALVYTSARTVDTRPDVTKRYIRALVQAEQYLKTHPKEAQAILADKMRYTQDHIDYLWPKIDFSLSLSQELLLTMENEARYAIANKLTSETEVPNYLDYIDFNSLSSVKPEAVTIVH